MMRDNLLLTGMFAAIFAGCSLFGGGPVDEDNWSEKSATAMCKSMEKCYRAAFEAEYDDVADCVDNQMDLADEYSDYYDDCDFDDGNAQDCLDSINEADCGDFYDDPEDVYEACLEVWDCG